ncbi:dehydrogenase, partial [Mycobacterium tuberculosis]
GASRQAGRRGRGAGPARARASRRASSARRTRQEEAKATTTGGASPAAGQRAATRAARAKGEDGEARGGAEAPGPMEAR